MTVMGVVAIASRSQEVRDFEAALRLGCQLYLNEDKPKLASGMLREREGMSDLRLKKLNALLQNAPMLTAGGATMADGTWEFVVSEECHHLLDITSAVAYVAQVEHVRTQAGVRLALGGVANTGEMQLPGPDARVAPEDDPQEHLLGVVDGLHSRIRDACRQLVEHGHLTLAVHKATIALKDLLKEQSGLPLDNGDDLVN